MPSLSCQFYHAQELTTFRNIINTYKSWAVNMSNDNIIDVARTIETVLGTDFAREQLMTYRVDHLRRLGIFEISEEELRKQKAERNRQRAMAKRIQMEQQKEDELRKAAAKDATQQSDDELSEDEDMSGNDSSDSS